MKKSAYEVASALGGAKKAGMGWVAKCPAHNDNKASLSLTDSGDKLLFRCHAGCSQDAVARELAARDLFGAVQAPVPAVGIAAAKVLSEPTTATERRLVAEYSYTDELGACLYQALRYEPKDFRQRRPDGKGGWIWAIGDVRRVLYRLPRVIEAVKAGVTVYVVEGEKDVHTAEGLGLVATCNVGGANKWRPEYSEILRGADVVVIPDNDAPGEKSALAIIAALQGIAKRVRVCPPAVGKDLSDWVEAGAGLASIEAAAVEVSFPDQAADLQPPAEKPKLFDLVGDLVNDLKPIRWMVRDYFEQDALSEVFGKPGCGKSFVTVSLAASVATGTRWNGQAVNQGAVFYIAGEGHNGLARRFAAWSKHTGVSLGGAPLYKSRCAVPMMNAKAAEQMRDIVHELATQQVGSAPAMVVFDTVARNFGDGDENSTQDMNKFIENIDRFIRQAFKCAVVLVHHEGHVDGRARGSSALRGAIDAEYRVERDEESNLVKFTSTKMKDAEIPGELSFKFQHVALGERDGETISSAVLVQDSGDSVDVLSRVLRPASGHATEVRVRDVIQALQGPGLSRNELADSLGVRRESASEFVSRCEALGLIQRVGSGSQSVIKSSDKAKDLLGLSGSNLI